MKPGLALSRFYPADAVRAEKIDEHIKLLAEQVNGGLTVNHLAASTRLSRLQLAEGASVIFLSAVATGQAVNQEIMFGSVQNGLSYKLVGVGWHLLVSNASLNRSIFLSSFIGSTTVGNVQTQHTETPRGIAIHGLRWIDGPFGVSAGEPLSVTWTVASGEVMLGSVTLAVALEHTS